MQPRFSSGRRRTQPRKPRKRAYPIIPVRRARAYDEWIDEMILNMTDTTPEPEDYTGEDGLLYCGKCHKPKEGYFPQRKRRHGWDGDRHPARM